MTPLEQQLHDDYTFAQQCVVEGEPDAQTVWLKVGNQQFCVTPVYYDNADEAEWMRVMLSRALARLVASTLANVVANTVLSANPE